MTTFSQIFSSNNKILSLEFFPPKKIEGLESTKELIRDLSGLNPNFMTCTYGAGGSTRDLTKDIVSFIHRELNIPAVAHLTCVGHAKHEIDKVLEGLVDEGISHILALRGDPPKGETNFQAHPDGFTCARDLAKHISNKKNISVAVAGYPETHAEAKSPEADIEYLREKVDAGAELIFTQLFFEAEVYFDFCERAQAAGINVPISPGIMPIASVQQVKRFTKMCGASIPKSLGDSLSQFEGEEGVTQFGIDYATELSSVLLEGGAPGIHLYTLNKSVQSRPIIENLSSYF